MDSGLDCRIAESSAPNIVFCDIHHYRPLVLTIRMTLSTESHLENRNTSGYLASSTFFKESFSPAMIFDDMPMLSLKQTTLLNCFCYKIKQLLKYFVSWSSFFEKASRNTQGFEANVYSFIHKHIKLKNVASSLEQTEQLSLKES